MSNWRGGKDGAIVVVSHDRAFCESVGFTHVGTVMDGGLVIEERGLDGRDWACYDIASTSGDECDALVAELTPEQKAEQEQKRKLAFNAPKRISRIEELIEKAEMKIAMYDEQMLEFGRDVDKLMEMTEKKTKEEESVANLMEEWESLEEVMAEMSAIL